MGSTLRVGNENVTITPATIKVGHTNYPVRNIQIVRVIPAPKVPWKILSWICRVVFAGSYLSFFIATIFHPYRSFFSKNNLETFLIISGVLAFVFLMLVSGMVNSRHGITFNTASTRQQFALSQPVGLTMREVVTAIVYAQGYPELNAKYDENLLHISEVAERITQALHELQHTK